MADDCPFCLIAAGKLTASVVHEGDDVLAFMDTDPVTPGHVLVASRAHLPGLADLSEETAHEMFAVARAVARALRASAHPRSTPEESTRQEPHLRCEGVNLFYADGEQALQEIPHAHMHVIPRFEGDGFGLTGRWGSSPPRAELDAHAATIRGTLATGPAPSLASPERKRIESAHGEGRIRDET